jgi:cystathionine beta-synthase
VWRQTEGKITHFVAGLGTGGTISGTGRFLKEKNPRIKIIGADPYGSIFKTFKETGKIVEATPYLVEGIGQEIVPPNVHIKYVDEVINVTDRESFEMSRMLGRIEGIFCGGSTGTNLAAALRVATDLDDNAIVVFIVCDTGEHYLSKHHSDEWLKEKRLLEPQKITAGLISGTKKPQAPKTLVSVAPLTQLAARSRRWTSSVSPKYLFWKKDERLVRCVKIECSRKWCATGNCWIRRVSEVMEASFPTVDVDVSSSEVTRRLQTSQAVLVEEYGRIIGIITRHDVLDLKNVVQ